MNFARYADICSRMSNAELAGALADINATLLHADAIDRETGTDNGGKYRDQASVIHKEIKSRNHAAKMAAHARS